MSNIKIDFAERAMLVENLFLLQTSGFQVLGQTSLNSYSITNIIAELQTLWWRTKRQTFQFFVKFASIVTNLYLNFVVFISQHAPCFDKRSLLHPPVTMCFIIKSILHLFHQKVVII